MSHFPSTRFSSSRVCALITIALFAMTTADASHVASSPSMSITRLVMKWCREPADDEVASALSASASYDRITHLGVECAVFGEERGVLLASARVEVPGVAGDEVADGVTILGKGRHAGDGTNCRGAEASSSPQLSRSRWER